MHINTVAREACIEFEEKKSKFIGYIRPVKTVSEAEEFISQIKFQHTDATHNVPLYRIIDKGQEYLKYNDDGEPSGTAGKPMADIAIVQQVYNFAIVATRYFGGVKLGAGGLIRMYAKTAKLAIKEAGIVLPSSKVTYKLTYGYEMTAKIAELIARYGASVDDEIYTDKVSVVISVEKIYEMYFDNIYNVDSLRLS